MIRFSLDAAGFAIAAAAALLLALCFPARPHDYKRPDLDGWYSSLHRQGSPYSCCNKEDCHTTEAKLRDGVWWARLGTPIDRPDGSRDWILGDYVRIPDELIVRDENGLPVPNPEGEAVICHDLLMINGKPVTSGAMVFCFVPGTQS